MVGIWYSWYHSGMEYEVKQDGSEWRVEAIDYESEGEVYVAIFSGPQSQERAEEYADVKNDASLDSASMLMGAEPPQD